MHFLSKRNRDEFLATPELVRFTLANGKDGPEPTLLVKTSTLTLKYLISLKKFRVGMFRVGENWIGYGLLLEDDVSHPATIWSLLEYPDELQGILGLTENSKCAIFLFNELALNVAWAEAEIDLSASKFRNFLNSSELHPVCDSSDHLAEVGMGIELLRDMELKVQGAGMLVSSKVVEWYPITNHYLTNRVEDSKISILDTDEGRQQEELAHWLTDNLHPLGAVRSPQIHEEAKIRELSDILLSYENGCFLIESKTLGIWARQALPSRNKLANDVAKHLRKAVGQLIGGVKNIRRGLKITDVKGNDVEVERKPTPHVIVLVPDLNLLIDAFEFDGDFFKRSCEECDALFHILDLSELLRIVQAANMISARSTAVTPMEAFDCYLIERSKISWEQKTPYFNVLLRFQD